MEVALVERSPDFAQIAQIDFAREGLAVRWFKSTEEFTGSLASFRPDIVICDGFTLRAGQQQMYGVLRQRYPEVPVILASAGLLGQTVEAHTRQQQAGELSISHLWDKTDGTWQYAASASPVEIRLTDLTRQLLRETRIGRSLLAAMSVAKNVGTDLERQRLAVLFQGAVEGDALVLPVAVTLPDLQPLDREAWPAYRERVQAGAAKLEAHIVKTTGSKPRLSILGNSLSFHAAVGVIAGLADSSGIEKITLRRRFRAASANPGTVRTAKPAPGKFSRSRYTGKGVKVAVLDTGIDLEHPYLKVADSRSVVDGEGVDQHHRHGTHVAGIIASQSEIFPGLAPEVTLLNIKVLDHDLNTEAGDIVHGMDAAQDLGAHVICMSIGLNYLDPELFDGHGLALHDDECRLVRKAVRGAVRFGAVCVAAAGNFHLYGKYARSLKPPHPVVSELLTPAIVEEAITVGATDDQSPARRATFSSFGKSLDRKPKPEIVARGVAVISTVPVPRTAGGQLRRVPDSQLFGPAKGTSAAAPAVAAAVAMLIQKRLVEGRTWTSAEIRDELLRNCVSPLDDPGTGGGLLVFPN